MAIEEVALDGLTEPGGPSLGVHLPPRREDERLAARDSARWVGVEQMDLPVGGDERPVATEQHGGVEDPVARALKAKRARVRVNTDGLANLVHGRNILPELAVSEYRRVTEVTYLGAVYGTQSALRRMSRRNAGVIVQVGSALAYRAIPLQSAYCAGKHALQGFTEALRCELLHERSGVRVTMVQLPALNTPQFSWVKSRLPNKPQPVPPIFQPEVAAEAILWAAHHDRREVYVGWPVVKAVMANKIAPGFADHYLARTGYASQQTDVPEDKNRRDNLWDPVPGDHGAHGDFDARSKHTSWQFWLSKNRRLLSYAALALTAMLAAAGWQKSALPR